MRRKAHPGAFRDWVEARTDPADQLGDLLDLNLRRGLMLTNGDPTPFFTRPISAVICLIIVFTILMSIPAVKGVEIGLGFEAARRFGSQVHDVIETGYTRASNRAGGLEGGMTTGEPLVLRVAMKPLSTLMAPLATVDLSTGESAECNTWSLGSVQRR